MTPRASLVSRARKIAAHATYDTAEGEVARGILGRLLAAHPRLSGLVGWRLGPHGDAVRGEEAREARAAGAAGPEERTRPARSRRGPRGQPDPIPPRIATDQQTRTYVPVSRFQYRLVAALVVRHSVSVQYVENRAPGAPARVVVSGKGEAVAAFARELWAYGSAWETILDAVSAALVDRCFPGAPPPPSMSQCARSAPCGPGSPLPDASPWMRDALKWERRVSALDGALPMPAIRAAAAAFVAVATRWDRQ